MLKLSSAFVVVVVSALLFLTAELNAGAVSVEESIDDDRNGPEPESRLEDLCKKYGSTHTMCLPKAGPDCGSGSVTLDLLFLS